MGYYDNNNWEGLEYIYSIEDIRTELSNIPKYFMGLPDWETFIDIAFVKERQLPIDIAKEHEIFFVSEDLSVSEVPEWMQNDSYGFIKWNKFLFAGRLVYPVKDVKGQVMGFCGWDKFVNPKYLDSRNYGYIAKQTTMYGMEKLPEYYVSDKPVFFTEGIVCCLYLRSLGYQACALLGSHVTPYVKQIINRFGNNAIIVPDNDNAGDNFVRQCKFSFKRAIIIQVKYGKDIDGCRKIEDHKYENLLKKDLTVLNNPFCKLEMFIRR